MDTYLLSTISDTVVRVLSSGVVLGEHTHFGLSALSPAQAVAMLVSRGWIVNQVGSFPITFVCRKDK